MGSVDAAERRSRRRDAVDGVVEPRPAVGDETRAGVVVPEPSTDRGAGTVNGIVRMVAWPPSGAESSCSRFDVVVEDVDLFDPAAVRRADRCSR
jgi:hypothetical protein